MARIRRDETFWKERIEQWSASGLSAQQFATREGLRRERLFYWKQRLRGSAAISVAGMSFARAEIGTAPSERASEPLEVVTRTGHVVRVAAGFDEGALRRLLTVLGGT